MAFIPESSERARAEASRVPMMVGVDAETRPGTGGVPSVATTSIETALLKALLYAVAFVASVLISRGLGPTGRGEYYLPVIAAGTMVVVCRLGLDQVSVFLHGTLGIPLDRLHGQNGLVALGAGVLGGTGLILAARVLPALFSGTPLLFLVLMALSIPFALHTQFTATLLALQGRVTWQFRAALFASLAQAGALLMLWALRVFDVFNVLAVYLGMVLVNWLVMMAPLHGRYPAWIAWSPPVLRESLRHSLLIHLGMVLFFLQLRLDMFMVKGLVGLTALGLYSLAVVLAETVLLPTDALAMAILPRQVGNTAAEAAILALRAARTSGILGLFFAVWWALAGAVVIRVFFGTPFVSSYLPLLALLPGVVFLGIQRACGGAALRAGQPGRITAIYALALLANILLNLWWIPRWGVVGAALSSTVSYGLSSLLFLSWISRLADAPLADGVIPRRSDWQALWLGVVQASGFLMRADGRHRRILHR